MTKLSNQKDIKKTTQKGFTLIETLVAITVLTIAVAAPLTLAAQSLMAAYTARDQVTAFHLAQEAIETVRAQRDHNILNVVKNGGVVDWLDGLDVELVGAGSNKPFLVDSLSTSNNFILCGGSTASSCDYLKFDTSTGFYGHENGNSSRFKRFVRITEVPGTNAEEMTVRAEVQWRAGILGNIRSVIIEENIYKWVAGIITTP